jgi:hypothetical protein
MSLSANIDHLAIAAGIEAVVVDTGSREYRGDEKWHRVLDGALDLFRRTDEKSIRLVVGKHTIVVQKEGEETVAVVLPTGHAIAKSLRRMIRRMARKDRGPLPKDFPTASPTQQPGMGTPPSPSPSSPGSQGAQGTQGTQGMGVTTPSPSPVSSPTPTPPSATPPSGGQPSVAPQPKTGEEAKPGTANQASPERPADRGASDRGGFHNF